MRRFTWYAITASASINAATKDPRSAWVSQSVLLMIARRTRINDRASVATRPSSEFSSASARHRTSSVSRNSKSFSRSSSGKWMEWAIRCDARCDAAPSRLLPAPPILSQKAPVGLVLDLILLLKNIRIQDHIFIA